VLNTPKVPAVKTAGSATVGLAEAEGGEEVVEEVVVGTSTALPPELIIV